MNLVSASFLGWILLIGPCLVLETVQSHGVEVRECITDKGNLRIFVEHWHGNLATPGQAGTMKIRYVITLY